MKVYILNGPNLGRLGSRQPDIYGEMTYEMCAEGWIIRGKDLGLDVEVRQTDAEYEMIGWLHEAADEDAAVILNAGAWTHYSYAIRDACSLLRHPLIEVHISNIYTREDFRHHSVISGVATGVICGLGTNGYMFALEHLSLRDTSR